MCRETSFYVEGTVIKFEQCGLVWIELVNGHRVIGHMAHKQLTMKNVLETGCRVTVKLSPSDLSHGRIILDKSKL